MPIPSGEFTDRGETIERDHRDRSVLRATRAGGNAPRARKTGQTSDDVCLPTWVFRGAQMSCRDFKTTSAERVSVVTVVFVYGQARKPPGVFELLSRERVSRVSPERVSLSIHRRQTDSKRPPLLQKMREAARRRHVVLLQNTSILLRVRRVWTRHGNR